MRYSKFLGDTVGRSALALIRAGGDRETAIQLASAKREWGDDPAALLKSFAKAAVAPGTTTDPTWAGPLVPTGAAEFIELVQRASLPGRIGNLMPAPANAALVETTANASGYWVGENRAKPLSALALKRLGSVPHTKVIAAVVITNELERASGIAGEALITRSLSTACASAIDSAFTDPTNLGIPGIKPAFIAAGSTPIPSSGNLLADLATALAEIANPSAAVVVMNSIDGAKAAAERGVDGALLNPDMSVRGGSLGGVPAYTSDSMPPGSMIVFSPPRVFLWEGGMSLSYSNQATIAMDDAPTDPATASTLMTSLWASDMHALMIEIGVSWMPAANAATVVTGILASAP